MKRQIIILVLLFFLVGCSSNVGIITNEEDYTEKDIMMALHCLEMKMPGCEKYENIKLTTDQIKRACEMMHNMEICKKIQNENILGLDLDEKKVMNKNLKIAKKSQILKLNNGDKINLSIDEVIKEIAGNKVKMFAYNGQIPGPLLHVKQNSTIYLNVTNNLDIDTTIHWHGLRLENEFDGVPKMTMEVQKPGESFEYKLDFIDEGIYWYHPHVREDFQQEMGLYGNMLVEPKYSNYYNNVNQEIPLILDDILIENHQISSFSNEKITHSLMGRFGNVMLINGEDNYTLRINQGDVIRFYLTNVANTRTFNFSIPNTQIKLIGSDIGSYEREEYLDSIIIAPAQRYTIEVYFKKKGKYSIKNINPHKEYTLGNIIVFENKSENDYSMEFFSLRENNYVKEDIEKFREYFEKEVDVKIDLEIEMNNMNMNSMLDGLNEKEMREHCEMMPNMQGCEFIINADLNEHETTNIEWEDEMEMMNLMSNNNTIRWILKDSKNQKENMDIDLKFNVGDKIKIKLFNNPNSMHPMQHPIHFHGQRFLVLEKDGKKSENLVWKDTVLVPVGSSIDILLDITNPGEWMAHCHIAEHLQSGMMMTFKVSE